MGFGVPLLTKWGFPSPPIPPTASKIGRGVGRDRSRRTGGLGGKKMGSRFGNLGSSILFMSEEDMPG
jgi:hypothetical protein